MMRISQLFVYPVKSLGGISLQEVLLTDRGFQYDRRWMLVNEQHRFLTQRNYAGMALLQTSIKANGIEVFHKQQPELNITIPFECESTNKINVQIWEDVCQAHQLSPHIDQWFSDQLKINCKLVYMPDDSKRAIDPNYATQEGDITSFSDGYPVLLIGEASLTDLNKRTNEPIAINRFRPNIVFTGGEAYEEDVMEQFSINNITFFGVKPCVRCIVTTINQQTLQQGNEPLKTMAGYRKKDNKLFFGQNVIYHKIGRLKINDEIVVSHTKPNPFFN